MSVKLSQPQQMRLKRLLHMEYTLSELVEELQCSKSTLRRALAAGCPHRCNTQGTVYVVGDVFSAWYRQQPKREKVPLAEDETYCLRCKAARKMVNIRAVVANSPGTERVIAECEVCGAAVNRLRRADA